MVEKAAADPNADLPHPDYPGLTYGEVEKAKKLARLEAEKKQRAAAMARVTEQELKRIEQEEGVSTEEIVEITLNLSPDTKELVIDGKRYQNGRTVRVPASRARDMLYMQYRGWLNESARLGEDKIAFYAQKAQQTRQPIVINGRTGAIFGDMPTALQR